MAHVARDRVSARPWRQVLQDPRVDRHIVQLYRDPAFAAEAVAAWIAPALSGDGCAVLIGAPESLARIRERAELAGLDPTRREKEGRLVMLDARATLARFTRGGRLQAELFRPILEDVVGSVRAAAGRPRADVRAWGEMVDLLWHDGDRAGARELEGLWNDAIGPLDVRLLCSYGIDPLDEASRPQDVLDACAGHSLLLPEAEEQGLDEAVSAALVEVYGEDAAGVVRAEHARKRSGPTAMPPATAVLLSLREEDPVTGRRVLRAARRHLRR